MQQTALTKPLRTHKRPRQPRKVLLLGAYLWGGGAEWHILNLTWALRQLNIEADVAYLRTGSPGGIEQFRAAGISPLAVRPHTVGPLLRALRRSEYDLVHAHLFKAEVAGAILNSLAGTPLVVTRHGLDWDDLAGWEKALLQQFVHRRARGIIAVSEAAMQVCMRALGGRPIPVRLINCGLAEPLLKRRLRGTDIRSELKLADRPLLGTAARLVPEKALERLIQAVNLAGPALRDWHVLIAGDGPERARLVQLIRALDLSDRVHLLGWRRDALDIVAALDVFVLCSRTESFPLSLLEAMWLGKPAVVTDLPGIREVAGEAALYAPPDDPAALAHALASLAANPLQRRTLAEAACARARNFDALSMARKTVEFYRQVLQW